MIVSSNKMVKKVSEKLIEIDSCLKHLTIKQNEIGLLSGKTGIAIFWQYYSLYLNNDANYTNIISKTFEEVFDGISEGNNYHTFCNGIAGVGWAIEHFVQNKYMDNDSNEILEEIDPYLADKMIYDLEKENNYDFLHGAIGIGIYFLNHLLNLKSKEYLVQLIDVLGSQSIEENDGSLKWKSVVLDINEQPIYVFNLSLSHGMASIVAFLAKAYSKDINRAKSKYLLEGVIKYLLKNRLDAKIYNSSFRSWIGENNEEINGSRLAWCYGDLGIAAAIYQAGVALNRQDWINIAIEVLLRTSSRRDLLKETVIDAGLCHGTAGIAHIYNRMYLCTGIEKFKETSSFWMEETLNMAKFEDGLAGYKAWHGTENSDWVNTYGILEGIAGIGLSFISAISNIEPIWDECLLLS
jgi:hypothetical protein